MCICAIGNLAVDIDLCVISRDTFLIYPFYVVLQSFEKNIKLVNTDILCDADIIIIAWYRTIRENSSNVYLDGKHWHDKYKRTSYEILHSIKPSDHLHMKYKHCEHNSIEYITGMKRIQTFLKEFKRDQYTSLNSPLWKLISCIQTQVTWKWCWKLHLKLFVNLVTK